MNNVDCDHPKSEVTIIETASNREIGNTPPRFWTVHGECSKCDNPVEIDYEFEEIIS